MTEPVRKVTNWVDFPPARPDGDFPERGARGFEAGGPADRLEPCGELAALTGQALEAGMDRLTDDELIGVLPPRRPRHHPG
jgi:hypothetical protein